MDGFATLLNLNANPFLAHIPVIFLGVSHGAPERSMALTIGGADYILRPYVSEEVLTRVRIHLALIGGAPARSEEHTSELQSLMRISYAVFCWKKKKRDQNQTDRLQQI